MVSGNLEVSVTFKRGKNEGDRELDQTSFYATELENPLESDHQKAKSDSFDPFFMRYFLCPLACLAWFVSPLVLLGNPSTEPHSEIDGYVQSLYPERVFPQLDSLLEALEESSPPTLIDRLRIEESRDQVVIARSRRLPDIFADLQFNVTGEDREDFDSLLWRNRPFNRISLRQPLYHWNALKAGEEVAELQLKNTALSYRQNLRNRKQGLRNAFFRLVEREYSLQLAKSRVEVAKRSLESVELSRELGEASDSDLLRAQYRLQNEQGRVLFQTQSLEQVRFQIFEQTGVRVDQLERFDNLINRLLNLDFQELDYPGWDIRLIDEESRILENRIEQAEQDLVIQRSRNRPKVNLLVSAFQDEINTAGVEESITRNNLFFGFQVVWNIWDGGEGRARSRIALNRKAQLEKALELTNENLREEFRFLIDRLQQMVKLLRARQVQIEAMDGLLQQSRVEVEQGRAIADQLLDDQIDLDNAKLLYLRSVTDYFLTLAQIADLLTVPPESPETESVE